jgi:hypothetical protein
LDCQWMTWKRDFSLISFLPSQPWLRRALTHLQQIMGMIQCPQKKRQEFDTWYAECLRKNQIFDFEEELKMYCKQDIEILFQGFESFWTLVKDLSAELLEDADQSSVLKVERNPVSHEWLSDDSGRKAREHSESKLKHLADQIPCEADFHRHQGNAMHCSTSSSMCHITVTQ